MIELSITVKDENSRVTEKDIVNDPYPLSIFNHDLKLRVEHTIEKHGADPEADAPDVIVTAKMVWQ